MKKIVSLLLAVMFVASMVVMPIGADTGNDAIRFRSPTASSYWSDSLLYLRDYFVKRKYGSMDDAFDYTFVFDFRIDDYFDSSDTMSGFYFSPIDCMYAIEFGYCVSQQQFVVGYFASTDANPNTDAVDIFKSVDYPLEMGRWYEMGYRVSNSTVTMYLDGIAMMAFDFMVDDPINPETGRPSHMPGDAWEWLITGLDDNQEAFNNRFTLAPDGTMRANGDWLCFAFNGVDAYMDNLAIYSGDYNFKTKTARETYASGASAGGEFFGNFSVQGSYWSIAPDMGTEKVTYDPANADHVHNYVANPALSKTVACEQDGYDLVECSCGAQTKYNFVKRTGHTQLQIIQYIIDPTDTNMGVANYTCTACGKTNIIQGVELKGNDRAAYLQANEKTSGFANGYLGVGAKDLFAAEDGYAIVMDVMLAGQTGDFARFASDMSAKTGFMVGYSIARGEFYIESDGKTLVSAPGKIDNWEWHEWAFIRDHHTISLSIDGEKVVSYEMAETDAGIIGDSTLRDTYQYYLYPLGTNFYIDNIIIASPDFDLQSRAGVIYANETFNTGVFPSSGDYSVGGGLISMLRYNPNSEAGYTIGKWGRAQGVAPVNVKQDRALYIDSGDYKSVNFTYFYAPLSNDLQNYTTSANSGTSIEMNFSMMFNADDFCTDTSILGKSSARIGMHFGENNYLVPGYNVSGDRVGGQITRQFYAGYDFTSQQIIAGWTTEGDYDGVRPADKWVQKIEGGVPYNSTMNFYTQFMRNADGSLIDGNSKDYAIAADGSWHSLDIKFTYDGSAYTLSVTVDGNTVETTTKGVINNISAGAFVPQFFNGAIDNLKISVKTPTVNSVLRDTDFTNEYTISYVNGENSTGGLYFYPDYVMGATGYYYINGGVPTHVYTEKSTPATCETDGYTDYICGCGQTDHNYRKYNIPSEGHTFNETEIIRPATKEQPGLMRQHCSVCDKWVESEIEYVSQKGDVNGDGVVDMKDLVTIQRYLADASSVEIDFEAADVNGDGVVKNPDLVQIRYYLAGRDSTIGK